MNYRYVISFLAPKKLQEQWSKPSSDWIIVKDYDDKNWSEEFCNIKGKANDDNVVVKVKAFVDIASKNILESDIRIYTADRQSQSLESTNDYRHYYNIDLDTAFYLTKDEEDKMGEEVTQKIIDFLETVVRDKSFREGGTEFSEILK